MDICPVVRIKTQSRSGSVDINASDFDPEVHELYVAELVAAPALPVEPVDDVKTDAVDELSGNWKRDKSASELRELAEAISGRTPSNKDESIAVIDAEIASRAAPAVAEIPPPPPIV